MSEAYRVKIAALLAKAEDPAATGPEAEAYTAKAEALMVKWGIEEAVVRSQMNGKASKADPIEQDRYRMGGTYHRGEYEIGAVTAEALGLKVLVGRSAHMTTLYVIGHRSDLDRFASLFGSLRIQATTAVEAWVREERAIGAWTLNHHEKFKARRQFLMSFGWAVARRLRTTTTAEVATVGKTAEVALIDRQAQIDDWVSEKYPNLGKARGGIGASYYGSDAGRKAGQSARLDTKGVAGKSGEIGGA